MMVSAPLAQLSERRSHNPEVVSTILTGSRYNFAPCNSPFYHHLHSTLYTPPSFCTPYFSHTAYPQLSHNTVGP